MDHLPHEPKSFREMVEADLRRAGRLIVKVQDCGPLNYRCSGRHGEVTSVVNAQPDHRNAFDINMI